MLFSRECAQTQNRENMNTKHKRYKEYKKVEKVYCDYKCPDFYLDDWRERELFDQYYSYKFYCFRNSCSDSKLKSRYANMLNKQDKTFNKRILYNILKLEHIDEALTYNTEFIYHHKNRSWRYI